ncbi:hypothetical protein [Nocardia tengchongensis]
MYTETPENDATAMETSVEVSDAPIGFGQAPGKSIGNRVIATTRTRDFGRDYRGLICSGANEKRRGDQPKVAAPLFTVLSLKDDVGGGCSHLSSGAVGGGDDWIRLDVQGWMLDGQLVVRADETELTMVTAVRYPKPVGRPVWKVLSNVHRYLTGGLHVDAYRVMQWRPSAASF